MIGKLPNLTHEELAQVADREYGSFVSAGGRDSRATTRNVPVPRSVYEIDEALLRFPCEECGKLLGADPAMAVVQCSKCRLINRVPGRDAALDRMSQPVRLVSVDIPLRTCPRMGCRLAVAAIPVIAVLTLAAGGVVTMAWWLWTARGVPLALCRDIVMMT